MNIQTLRQAVKPHLPTQADPAGVPVARLVAACQADLDAPQSPDPYPAEMADPAQVNRDLQALARGAQADLGGRPLSVGQLQQATVQAGESARAAAEQSLADRKELRSAYFKQVGWTTACMAATAGTLVVGGLFPNPVSLVLVGGACVMSIRSLNKARARHRELVEQTPLLEANYKASQQLAAGAGFYAPLLSGWNELLKRESAAA